MVVDTVDHLQPACVSKETITTNQTADEKSWDDKKIEDLFNSLDWGALFKDT